MKHAWKTTGVATGFFNLEDAVVYSHALCCYGEPEEKKKGYLRSTLAKYSPPIGSKGGLEVGSGANGIGK